MRIVKTHDWWRSIHAAYTWQTTSESTRPLRAANPVRLGTEAGTPVAHGPDRTTPGRDLRASADLGDASYSVDPRCGLVVVCIDLETRHAGPTLGVRWLD